MLFGNMFGPGGRAIWLLLAVGGLLIWAGRSDAAPFSPTAAVPPVQPTPRLDRIDDGDVEARLAISGQMVVLRLRGGDLAALGERIAAGTEPEIAIRIDGRELFAAELRDVQVEGERLEFRPPAPPSLILEPAALVSAVVAAPGTPDREDEAAEDRPGSPHEEQELPGPTSAEPTGLPVPEPGAAALLGAGLLGLGLAGRRSGCAVQPPSGKGMA